MAESDVANEDPMPAIPIREIKQTPQPRRFPKQSKTKKKKIKPGARAKHRLRSIFRDEKAMEDLRNSHRNPAYGKQNHRVGANSMAAHALEYWNVVANERCGSWYAAATAAAAPSRANTGGIETSGSSSGINCDSDSDSGGTSSQSQSPPSCYFKSTDGHVNVWDFSLKRLNLALLEQFVTVDGGCLLVDSSVRKLLPDSFSRTIPIWATVLNRIVLRYREVGIAIASESAANSSMDEIGIGIGIGVEDPLSLQRKNKHWDSKLYTPKGVVSKQEHIAISGLIDDRVETLFRSGAIVNPSKLVERLTKPLKVVWMNHEGAMFPSSIHGEAEEDCNIGGGGDSDDPTDLAGLLEDYFVIVCWNPSRYKLADENENTDRSIPGSSDQLIAVQKHQTEWISDGDGNGEGEGEESLTGAAGYFYTPGAGDDEESWARHLTPALFWKNQEALLDPTLDDDQVDALIDVLVQHEREYDEQQNQNQNLHRVDVETSHTKAAAEAVYSYSDKIGETNLWIGSRRASRPPECWSGFDAILNVTNQEYDGMVDHTDTDTDSEIEHGNRFYLQLPVEEGKRDRTQLEHWMPVGLAFLIHHLQEGRRVLVHCAQGKDRSVAIALVCVVVVCALKFPLRPKQEFLDRSWDLSTLGIHRGNSSIGIRIGIGNHDASNDRKVDNVNDNNDDACAKTTRSQSYLSSGLPEVVVGRLLDAGGKESCLLWIHQQLRENQLEATATVTAPTCLANKEGVRIALHLIRQDREVAEPTRSTMQKINRFLMSSSIYR